MASSYSIRNLQKLFDQLQPKQQRQALRGAMRRAATTVKREAIANLRTCVSSNKDLEKGIRTEVWKRRAGFKVTVAEKVKKHRYKGSSKGIRRYERYARSVWSGFDLHTNRRGEEKPVLVWIEAGTKVRKSKTKTRFRVGSDKWRMGKNHGFMKKYAFMAKTKNQVAPTITKTVQDEVITNVQRIAKRYGCS